MKHRLVETILRLLYTCNGVTFRSVRSERILPIAMQCLIEICNRSQSPRCSDIYPHSTRCFSASRRYSPSHYSAIWGVYANLFFSSQTSQFSFQYTWSVNDINNFCRDFYMQSRILKLPFFFLFFFRILSIFYDLNEQGKKKVHLFYIWWRKEVMTKSKQLPWKFTLLYWSTGKCLFYSYRPQ